MKITAEIEGIIYDDINSIKENIDNKVSFQLFAYSLNNIDNGKIINIWIEGTDEDMPCTIMLKMNCKEACMFAKSLMAMSE